MGLCRQRRFQRQRLDGSAVAEPKQRGGGAGAGQQRRDQQLGSSRLTPPPTQWKLAGIGKFTGNGTSDILWINTTNGEVGLWLINNAAISGWATLAYVDLSDLELQGHRRLQRRRHLGCAVGEQQRSGGRVADQECLRSRPGTAWPTPTPRSGRLSAWGTSPATAPPTCSGRTRSTGRWALGSSALVP